MADQNMGSLSTLYRIEQLKENNWFSWKMKIETILDDRGLDGYIDGTRVRPAANSPLLAEIDKWNAEDKKTRTIIKLLVHDTQAIHCAGAQTAQELWNQLRAVKEPRGQAGILTWHKKLYGTRAKQATDIPMHLKSMREIYEMLHVMGDAITDQEFKNALMTSLPKSWEQFLTIYTQPGATASNITSYELYVILIEEDRRRKDGSDDDDDSENKRKRKKEIDDKDDAALMAYPNKRKFADRIGPKKCGICKKPGHRDDQCWHKGKTCFNCMKPGHTKEDCWCPGGGKAGQGPKKGHKFTRFKAIANVATTSGITEISDDPMPDNIAFMADDGLEYVDSEQSEEHMIWYEWVADSGATSHIAKSKTVMTDYVPLTSRSISGIGNESINAIGQGTVHLINYIGKAKISFTASVKHKISHSWLHGFTLPTINHSCPQLHSACKRPFTQIDEPAPEYTVNYNRLGSSKHLTTTTYHNAELRVILLPVLPQKPSFDESGKQFTFSHDDLVHLSHTYVTVYNEHINVMHN